MYFVIADTFEHFRRWMKEKRVDSKDARYINYAEKLYGTRIMPNDKVVIYGPLAQRFYRIFMQVQLRRD